MKNYLAIILLAYVWIQMPGLQYEKDSDVVRAKIIKFIQSQEKKGFRYAGAMSPDCFFLFRKKS